MPGVVDHGLGRLALSVAISCGDHGVGNQPMTVVSEGVAHVAQPTGVVAFAVKPSIGIGAGLVRVIAAAFAFEVAAVAAIVTAVFTTEAFVTSPSLDECAVNAEVLAREQAFVLGLLQHEIEELDDGVMLDQTFPILGKYGGYPDGIVHGQANKPTKQEVVLGLLHELALRANAVEHLQQHGAQELLGRDAGAPAFDVGLVHA